jgi:hypothetical protein
MVIGGIAGGIVGVGVVIGAVLSAEFGGGVLTLAPISDPVEAGGMLPDIDEETMHVFVTASSAYPLGHVIVGSTVVVGVVNPSQLVRAHRTYHTTSRRATEPLTFWCT